MNCRLCTGQTKFFLTKDGFNLWRCLECGVVFVDPLPSDDFLRQSVYQSGVYQKNKEQNLAKQLPNLKTKITLTKLNQLTANKKLLDVGSSNGQFMYHAKQAGFEVSGVELNAGTAQIAQANGLEVFIGTLVEANLPNTSYDIVTLNDVIEHVPDPVGLIKEGERLLKNGGLLTVGTPNLNCLFNKLTWQLWCLFGISWSAVTPPHHLYQFSAKSLNRLMAQNGFKLVKMIFLPTSSLRYELGVTKLKSSFKQDSSLKFFLRFSGGYLVYITFYSFSKIWVMMGGQDNGLIAFYRKM
ncbi:MAG: class I SAM-dependent methyltransferase [Candidatus Vogelbacteria bacterium]|nr:class I SAM-dependent methyltransferase [Candidatus Vogelbacteria bacterium]